MKIRLLIAILLFTPLVARCSPIYISNFSFDSEQLAGPGHLTVGAYERYSADSAWASYTPDPIPGWNVAQDALAGVWQPVVPGNYNENPPDGKQVAYSNGARIWQVLSVTLQPSTDYTLTVNVGNRTDDYWDGYRISLYAGDTEVAFDDSSLKGKLKLGTFGTSIVKYTSGAGDPLIGQLLTIVLRGYGVSTVPVDFDSVQLNGAPSGSSGAGGVLVPEPTAFGLLAAGIVALALRRRR